jgi:hypothetical protein
MCNQPDNFRGEDFGQELYKFPSDRGDLGEAANVSSFAAGKPHVFSQSGVFPALH